VVAATILLLLLWQVAVWLHVRPSYALPGPVPVLKKLFTRSEIIAATATTMRRAAFGYTVALVLGIGIGLAVAGSKTLRAAVGSLITGLQTMPSIAWFPLAILLVGPNEKAMMFVLILGAAPAIANGLITAVDHIPPLLLSAGRVLGARGWAKYRHVVIPAALPSFVGGMKQGWAFAWRSLMAGELLVIIAHKQSLGQILQYDKDFNDSVGLIGTMIVILVIGIVVDRLFFARLERAILTRCGLAHT
jgi:NitT/TauT family transport system permease protein